MEKYNEINENIKALILKHSGVDVNNKKRDRSHVEYRGLYFHLIKKFSPRQTYSFIGKSVGKDHATVMHSLKTYEMNERYNPELLNLKNIISSLLFDHSDVIRSEKDEIEMLKDRIVELTKEIEKIKDEKIEKKHEFNILNKFNSLLLNSLDTDIHDLLLTRLCALYDMNEKIVNKNNG